MTQWLKSDAGGVVETEELLWILLTPAEIFRILGSDFVWAAFAWEEGLGRKSLDYIKSLYIYIYNQHLQIYRRTDNCCHFSLILVLRLSASGFAA